VARETQTQIFLLAALFFAGWMLAEYGAAQCRLLEQDGLVGSSVYYASLTVSFIGLLMALASLACMFKRASEIVVEKDDDENSGGKLEQVHHFRDYEKHEQQHHNHY
jgi:hypothetical protein